MNGGALGKHSADGSSLIRENWPTDLTGWLVSYCSKLLREGLTMRFAKAGYNVSPEQWSIVVQLWQQDGLPQQVLAERFHRSKVAAFHLISKLEGQGLVVRRPNPKDGRSNLIRLTPEGRAMVAKLIPAAQGNLDQALAGVSDADLKTAKWVLYKIANNMTDEQIGLCGPRKEVPQPRKIDSSVSVRATTS
jgi:DNA-binding MarR family transcriptional regulator